MEFRDLKYYCQLLETRSFASTAEAFGVTQPAITAMTKRLQKEFGIKLIYQRNSRSTLTVTPAGKVLYLNAKKMIQQEKQVKEEVIRASQSNFRLGYSEFAGDTCLAKIITRLNQKSLLADVETHMENSNALETHLCEGKYDAIIYSQLVNNHILGINAHTFMRHEYKIAISVKSPLAQQNSIDIWQLQDMTFILRHKNYLSRTALDKVFMRTGFAAKKTFFIDNIPAIRQLVAQNMGISYLMDFAIDNIPGIKALPLSGQREFCETKLGVREDFIPNPTQKKCLDFLRKMTD